MQREKQAGQSMTRRSALGIGAATIVTSGIARRLAATMSQAWIDFARTGNPGSARLAWPPFDDESIPTLVFDRRARVERDPLKEVRNLVLQASA